VIVVLIYILLVVVCLLGLVLLAPIQFAVEGEYAERVSIQGRLRWTGGLLRFEIIYSEGKFKGSWGILWMKKLNPMKAGKRSKKEKPSQAKKPRTSKEGSKSNGNISSFLNPELFRIVKDVFHKLLQALHLRMNLSGTFGFDDPALTGLMAGLIGAIGRGASSIDLTPDFTSTVVDMRGTIQGWIMPLQILVIGIVFMLMKPVRAIWWPKIKFRKKQKEAVQYA
jgi:hypothetical protein